MLKKHLFYSINEIAELKAKDKKLWEKIKDYFTELLSKIKKVYNKLLPDSTEGRFVKGILSEVERLQELWTDALVDAAENYTSSNDSNGGVLYSSRDVEKTFNIKSLNDYVGVQKTVIKTLLDEGFFEKENSIVKNINSGMVVEITKDGIRETLGTGNRFQQLPRQLKKLKLATIRMLPKLIKTAEIKQDNVRNTHNSSSEVMYAYLSNDVTIEDDLGMSEYAITITIRKSPQKNKFWIHEVRATKKESRLSSGEEMNSQQEYNKTETLEGSVPQNSDSVNKKFSDRYSYEALTSKPDMYLTTINNTVQYKPTKSIRKKAVEQALNNANSIGDVDENGGVSVYVNDINKRVILSRKGLEHGLDRRFSDNLPATLKAGELLQNSIIINEITPQKPEADSAYVLIGAGKSSDGKISIVRFIVNTYTNELTSVDVLYALNTKKELAVLNAPPLTNDSLWITNSSISISQLLDFVNKHFPDILPEDVLKHYGYKSRPEGKVGESAIYSDRDPEAIERMEKINEFLKEENEQLKEDVFRLEELVKIQQQVTNFTKTSVDAAANYLMNISHAKGSKNEFAKILNEFYSFIAKGEELTWYGICKSIL